MYDYSKNFEFIGDYNIFNQNFCQIKCIKEYYDFYEKRTIKKGELGGFVNKNSIQYIDKWISRDCYVGDCITETCYIKEATKETIPHSNIQELKNKILYMIKNWWWKAETFQPSIINAIIYKSQLIPQFIFKLYTLEEICINQNNNITETDQIVLWTLLGAIQEAILKNNLTVCRERFVEFLGKKDLTEIDNIKVSSIITEMVKLGHVSEEESITLETINSNRNMIHFISNRPVHNYEKYLNAVDEMVKICYKIFKNQQEHLVNK